MRDLTFCNKILSLISETDVDRLMLNFNELIDEQYAAAKTPALLKRSIRQAHIRSQWTHTKFRVGAPEPF